MIDYLASAVQNGWISDLASKKSLELLFVLKSHIQDAKIDIGIGIDMGLMMVLDDGCNHLEFEIFENGKTEVFFLNRETNEMIDEDVGEDLNLSEAVIGKLKLFERG